MLRKPLVLAFAAAAILAGCKTLRQHSAAIDGAQAGNLTVGKVQRKIRVGMPGAEVAAVLGSPNVVTTDEARREVWVYDKISTTSAYSTSSGGVSALILCGSGGNPFILGGGSANYAASSGANATTQRTLTVIVKFDERGLVRDFSYHSSRF